MYHGLNQLNKSVDTIPNEIQFRFNPFNSVGVIQINVRATQGHLAYLNTHANLSPVLTISNRHARKVYRFRFGRETSCKRAAFQTFLCRTRTVNMSDKLENLYSVEALLCIDIKLLCMKFKLIMQIDFCIFFSNSIPDRFFFLAHYSTVYLMTLY